MKIKPSGISFVVPSIPPSANHYILHTRTGRHYKSQEAHGFNLLVLAAVQKLSIRWKHYGVEISIFLGKKQKLDIDNAAKCTLDALVTTGVIDSDSKVTELRMFKSRDLDNPRTVISVWAV